MSERKMICLESEMWSRHSFNARRICEVNKVIIFGGFIGLELMETVEVEFVDEMEGGNFVLLN